jgi:predicted nucleic acid-binding Zn ribbon protein
MIRDQHVELARRVRLLRQHAAAERAAAAWSEHDAYGCHVRGLFRQATGLERQASRQRAAANDLDAQADELESSALVRPARVTVDGGLAV